MLVKLILVLSFYVIRHTVNLIEGETEIGEIKVERGGGHRSGEVKKKTRFGESCSRAVRLIGEKTLSNIFVIN